MPQNELVHCFDHHLMLSVCFVVKIGHGVSGVTSTIQNAQNLGRIKMITKVEVIIIVNAVGDCANRHISMLKCREIENYQYGIIDGPLELQRSVNYYNQNGAARPAGTYGAMEPWLHDILGFSLPFSKL